VASGIMVLGGQRPPRLAKKHQEEGGSSWEGAGCGLERERGESCVLSLVVIFYLINRLG